MLARSDRTFKLKDLEGHQGGKAILWALDCTSDLILHGLGNGCCSIPCSFVMPVLLFILITYILLIKHLL